MTAANRTALVTGAARGIGLAIATRLALDGHPVIMLDASPDVLASATNWPAAACARAACSWTSRTNRRCADLPRQCGLWWENLAIVVNNAGISPKHEGRKRKVAEMPLDEWRRVLEVNLTGTFLVTQTCLPALIAAGWGRVIMITSQAARTRTPVPGAHYSATKSGMTGLARVLAGEVAEHGITVNCVAPGRIQSAMTAEAGGAVNASHSSTVPLGRLGLPEEVAATVAFLASDGAGYTTGATIDVNGGSFML